MTEERELEILNTYLEVKNCYKTRQICHCGSKTMDRIMTKYNLHCSKNTVDACKLRAKITDEQILESVETMTRQEIADKFGVHVTNVDRRIKKLGVHAKYKPVQKSKSKRKRKTNGHIKQRAEFYGVVFEKGINLNKLILRDRGICKICGEKVDVNSRNQKGIGLYYPTIDHIVPLSKGGGHTWENVQLAHMICNSIKCDNLERSM